MPGLVVLPLLALILSLAGAAALSVRPWEDDSVSPHLLPMPDIGVSIGDAVALPGALEPAVARAAAVAAPVRAESGRPDGAVEGSGGPRVALASNRVVLGAAPAPETSAPPASPPGAQGPQGAPPAAAPLPQPVAGEPAAPEPPPTRIIAGVDGVPGGLRSVVDVGGTAPPVAVVQVRAGETYALAFSFLIVRMAYGEPGADNGILRMLGEDDEEAVLGLHLWDDPSADPEAGLRGIWASGEQMGGDRFLAPAAEGEWHRAVVHLEASGTEGFYEVYLDGALVDTRSGLALPGESGLGRIELGLFRDPAFVGGASEVRFDDVELGASLDAVWP